MRIAREGLPQIVLSTVVLGGAIWAAAIWFWPAAIPPALIWIWSVAFFRDPRRETVFDDRTMCAPADGTVQDITMLDGDPTIGGPAVRVGIFLSLFNVHINRSPCAGTVRSVQFKPGRFLAAMNPAAGELNESNTLVIDPETPLPGPVIVRQIVGVAARRIVCHAEPGTRLTTGERFGLIKFGSRTELIVPRMEGTQVLVGVGDRVQAGLTALVRQSAVPAESVGHGQHRQNERRIAAATP
ncbi:MAG: phosphatidylserine decarboxylase [Phycisphaerales bacterium]|nr:phosphatidylserine decarboxylase [Phycisphaerales bacterium]